MTQRQEDKLIGWVSVAVIHWYVMVAFGFISKGSIFPIYTLLNENPALWVPVIFGLVMHLSHTDTQLAEGIATIVGTIFGYFVVKPISTIYNFIADDGYERMETPDIDMRDNYALPTESNVRKVDFESGKMKIVEKPEGETEIYIKETN